MGGTCKISYLDNACMGKVHEKVVEQIEAFLKYLSNISSPPTQVTVEMYNFMTNAREESAKLLGVTPDEIAVVESTSHGLGLIVSSIPIRKEENVLICDLEFFASSLCWKSRQEDIGFEIRKVKTKQGEVKVDDFEVAIDKKTRAIVISAVQEINGFRCDIKALSRLAREYGCYLIVDGIQEIGALKVDLSNLDIDFYCAGGHKWLRNPFGAGILYINRKHIDRLKPSFYGYFNTVEPEMGWQAYLESPLRTPYDHFDILTKAQKFETGGTSNIIGSIGLYENIKIIQDYGIENIENKVKELGRYLIGGLNEIGLQTVSSIKPQNMSGIITFNLPGGVSQEKELCKKLEREGVFVSLRYTSGIGGIRVSPHYYNSTDDIDRLLNITEDFINGS